MYITSITLPGTPSEERGLCVGSLLFSIFNYYGSEREKEMLEFCF